MIPSDQIARLVAKIERTASNKALAASFGVSHGTISHVRRRTTWAHV